MRCGFVLLMAACASQHTAAEREITLTKRDQISIRTGTDGKSVITVTILAGKADAGTYTSASDALVDDARLAMNALRDPNSVVTVRVNESNEIVSFATAQMVDIRTD